MSEEGGKYWFDAENRELVLKTADGSDDRFYFQDKFEWRGQTYCILSPSESDVEIAGEDAEETALVMKVIEKDDEEYLGIIEDDEEFEKVSRHYYETRQEE